MMLKAKIVYNTCWGVAKGLPTKHECPNNQQDTRFPPDESPSKQWERKLEATWIGCNLFSLLKRDYPLQKDGN